MNTSIYVSADLDVDSEKIRMFYEDVNSAHLEILRESGGLDKFCKAYRNNGMSSVSKAIESYSGGRKIDDDVFEASISEIGKKQAREFSSFFGGVPEKEILERSSYHDVCSVLNWMSGKKYKAFRKFEDAVNKGDYDRLESYANKFSNCKPDELAVNKMRMLATSAKFIRDNENYSHAVDIIKSSYVLSNFDNDEYDKFRNIVSKIAGKNVIVNVNYENVIECDPKPIGIGVKSTTAHYISPATKKLETLKFSSDFNDTTKLLQFIPFEKL